MELKNQTSVTEFILLGFGNKYELQALVFVLFLVIYVVTVAGNILIIVLILTDQHLHTPMYFYLGNLSFLETCYSSTTLPRVLMSTLTGENHISFTSCITQFYFFGGLAAAECFLFSVMSYDRYLAVCKPLHYMAIMDSKLCLQLAAFSWISGFVGNTVTTLSITQLTFCGSNVIDHFICDFIPVIQLSCSDLHLMYILIFIFSILFMLMPFLLILTSYICIITAILRIPSNTGRQKAFSTCSSHLIVVTIFYGTLIIVYMFPSTHSLRDLSKMFSVTYTVLTPMVNPLIYSLRNKEVKEALKRLPKMCRFYNNCNFFLIRPLSEK
ncbi:olfactory receptor 6B1-like [Alligator sinensis]|uniref:Olfactory receptor 6B1-like n=1 Tax=Alligator sinensis TaxID=38654 RepID=A0A1U7SRV3_ALLSI|nr:olfactory receptor 6B1-like [Alligator sinensis]